MPDPDGPRSARNWPVGTVRLIPRSAWNEPNARVALRTSMLIVLILDLFRPGRDRDVQHPPVTLLDDRLQHQGEDSDHASSDATANDA